MDYFVPILLASVGVWSAGGVPLRDEIERRSLYGVYADEFAEEYEPYAVAAFPVHQPLSVVHLLPGPPPGSAAPHKRSVLRTPPLRDYAYAASEPEWSYSYEQYEQPEYSPSTTQSKYAKYSSYESQESQESQPPVLVYARPNRNGGYTYRRKPVRPAPKPQDPVIIRVHKYKVVRD